MTVHCWHERGSVGVRSALMLMQCPTLSFATQRVFGLCARLILHHVLDEEARLSFDLESRKVGQREWQGIPGVG